MCGNGCGSEPVDKGMRFLYALTPLEEEDSEDFTAVEDDEDVEAMESQDDLGCVGDSSV